jgi:arachidonate 15-lipoxygenase
MILWPAIRRWIDRYVGLYYHNDGDVLGDGELADFLALLRSEEGGDLRGVPSIGTVPALSQFIATLVWIATAQHSALNYAQYPYLSYAPNSPLALYAPPPKRDTPANELNWEEMLPNTSAALAQVDIAYQLSGVTHRALGDYASDAFSDPRVATILKRFREELAPIEARMRDRDRLRFLPYPYLFPSRVQTSVFI